MPQTHLCIQDYVITYDNENEIMIYSDDLNEDVNDEDEEDMEEYDKYYKPREVYRYKYDNQWVYEYKGERYIVKWIMFDRNGNEFRVDII